jgi:hypothetical protein
MKSRPAPPRAAALIESLRGMGYTTTTALADVIDNSISAGASRIRLDFGWYGADSYIRISDDGRGLTAEQMDEAMVLGSSNPLASRSDADLGRFGMGLKTASLSQCRRLTIASKSSSDINYRCWDIDYIGADPDKGWALLVEPFPSAEKLCDQPLKNGFTTVVLWEGLDRVLSRGFSESDFFELIDDVERHLAMTFHRFLEGPNPAVRIYINGEEQAQQVHSWDPFMRAHNATSATPVEVLPGGVAVQGYVLPHREKLTDKEFEYGAGASGWVARQGFYVYRGKRLLVAGSWLGLGDYRAWPKDDLHRLARLRLDLPNSLDQEWRIDIKKSVAKPPVNIKQRLIDVGQAVRADARRVFTHRGELVSSRAPNQLISAWQVSSASAGPRYKIDEAHPVIAKLLEEAGVFGGRIRQAFRVVEETVPIQRIWLDATESVDVASSAGSEHAPEDLVALMQEHFVDLINGRGMTPEAAREHLLRTAPFHRFPVAVAALKHQ